MTPQHGHMYRTYRAADVLFRLGAAFAISWIYLRTLIVVAPGTNPETWALFAWTGWPFVLMIWGGAIATTVVWIQER